MTCGDTTTSFGKNILVQWQTDILNGMLENHYIMDNIKPWSYSPSPYLLVGLQLRHQSWWSFLFTINNCGDNLHLHHGPSFCTNYDYGHLTRKHFCYQVTKLQLNLQLWNLDDPQVQEGVEVGRSLFLPKQHICGWVCKLWISHQ